MRRRWMIAMLVVCLAGIALWMVRPARVADVVPEPLLPAPTPVPGQWLPSKDLQENLAKANAGDVMAMRLVGSALRGCRKYVADPKALEIRKERELMIANLRAGRSRDEVGDDGLDAHWRDQYARRFATHADCLAIGAELVGTGLQWLERAARAGDPKAKIAYAEQAFKDFPDSNALLGNLDEVLQRRDLARAWAMQALDAGERGAINVIAAGYYGESPLFPRNLQQGAPYAMAQQMLGLRAYKPAEFRQLYDHGPASEEYGWGNENAWVHAAWQEALDRARAIVDLIPPDPPRPPPPRGG